MTTPPPPPPGSGPGGNQPYDPSGAPGPTPGGPPPPGGMPSYGSAAGQPPHVPPPAPGGAPQGGRNKGKTLAIISIVTGVLGLCYAGCFVFSIAALVLGNLGKKEAQLSGDSSVRTMALIGLVLGVVGIVLGILSWVLQLSGVWEPYQFNFETS